MTRGRVKYQSRYGWRRMHIIANSLHEDSCDDISTNNPTNVGVHPASLTRRARRGCGTKLNS